MLQPVLLRRAELHPSLLLLLRRLRDPASDQCNRYRRRRQRRLSQRPDRRLDVQPGLQPPVQEHGGYCRAVRRHV